MPYDITIIIDDLPGTLARVGESLGNAGINIEGYCSFPSGGKSYLHVLVEDVAAARRALNETGIEITQERQVLTVDMQDQPGELGMVARRIANAGVNIDMVYTGTKSRLVVVAYDLEKARSAV
ncbi:MAG: amino acid-binding protein [Chloroflexi bacterium]|nr:amino acid-binding protein [Chloroflexota bacterium]